MARDRTFSVTLSPDAAESLDAMAKRHGVKTRDEMLERLIFGTAPPQPTSSDEEVS